LHKFASGLGVAVDELFQNPREGAAFDRTTNPAAARVVDEHPELFAGWTPADYDELFSRVAVGGELTDEGALVAAQAMNQRGQLMKQVAVLLETDQADVLRDFIAVLYRRATSVK
jgi:hypothetical protein